MTPSDAYPYKKYLLVLGPGQELPSGQLVADRYRVISAGIWHDTQAPEPPETAASISPAALPYLRAYPYQLHVPTVYGVCITDQGSSLLLDNIPADRSGRLMPTLQAAWAEATAFRQAYWCWQLFELWSQLQEQNLGASLLQTDTVHVDGWRIRLSRLTTGAADLAELTAQIEALLPTAKPAVAATLAPVLQQCQQPEVKFDQVLEHLNRVLLTQAMTLTVSTEVAGGTSSGPNRDRNEDACYPSLGELQRSSRADLPSLPRIAIVCDGVGGHAGGEIASQTVVRSLQLQLRGLIAEIVDQDSPLPPQVVADQIEAAVRVANNLLASQNDSQGRTKRQRMGTTLVAAVVIPQQIPTGTGFDEVNELYVVHVGDSRAYWITPEACHLLTVDDDAAGQSISQGQQYPAAARRQDNSGALTQALGTREGQQLTPHIQRFLPDETGVLLLCSDGLSDNQRVETSWANYVGLIVKGIVPLTTAVESWLELAHQKNGHDDVSVVLMSCQVSSSLTSTAPPPLAPRQDSQPTEMTAASRALLYGETDSQPETNETSGPAAARRPALSTIAIGIISLVALGIMGTAAVLLWQTLSPSVPPELETAPPNSTDQAP